MKEKKALIIGAGIAGLSAGSFLQQNNYQSEIYEMHKLPGGLCTSWQRGDFTFDFCIHWLMGSKKGSQMNDLFTRVFPVNDFQFIDQEIVMDLELPTQKDKYGSRFFHFYSNPDKWEAYMLNLSPEDKKPIQMLCNAIRWLGKQEIPFPVLLPQFQSIKEKISMMKFLPFVFFIGKWKNMTNFRFAGKFKSPFLKEAFQNVFNGMDFNMMMVIFQGALYSTGNAGYPLGGSLALACSLEQCYLDKGGKIHYNSRVKKIITENNKACGIELEDGSQIKADIVISAADGHFTHFEALEGRYLTKELEEIYALKKYTLFPSAIQISLGLNKRFEKLNHMTFFVLESPLKSPCGKEYKGIAARFMHYEPSFAPPEKEICQLFLENDNTEYWTDLRKNDYQSYKKQKADFAEAAIEAIDKKLPGFKQSIEVRDIATPATVVRYTNNWKGSYEGWLPPKNFLKNNRLPYTLPELDNFYHVGQWMYPGGGIPPAVLSGCQATQLICARNKKKFIY